MGQDEETWQKIYRNLLRLLLLKQSEVEALVGERQMLKDRFFSLHERWLSDVDHLQGHIAKMRASLTEAEMDQMLSNAKMELMVATGRRETALYKRKSDRAYSDLEDLEFVVKYFISKETERKSKLEGQITEIEKKNNANGRDEMSARKLHEEIKKLKRMNEKLTSEKNNEVHALLQERNFVWNQLKKMESNYHNLLKAKRSELEHANQKITDLQQVADKSNLLVKEKDMTIGSLEAEIAKHEKNLDDCSRKISKLSKELQLLRISRNSSSMQVVRCSQAESISAGKKKGDTGGNLRRSSRKSLSKPAVKCSQVESSSGGTKDGEIGQSLVRLKREFAALQASSGAIILEKGSRKRARPDTSCKFEPLRLFSSNFKVPKLKNSSPHV